METNQPNTWSHLNLWIGRLIALFFGLIGALLLYIAYKLQSTEAALIGGMFVALCAAMLYWRATLRGVLEHIAHVFLSGR